MSLKLIGQGISGPGRTFVAAHAFQFAADALTSGSLGMRLATYHDNRWETPDGTLLARLDCPGPVLVLLFDSVDGTVAYPCSRCHLADGELYADDKPVAQLEPNRGWRVRESGRRFRTLEVREQAPLW
jgi:hypothetical protein